ncbi:MAG: hypothetical protein KDB80_09285 [Planctomycetes bacterium]|nr:hypothetical protein [Planctomycetota bacterium]
MPGRFLYAFGPRGLGVLERAIDRPADAPGSPPDALRNVRRSAPPGWNLAASVPADFFGDTLFEEILWETWKEIRRELPGQASQLGREDLDAALRRVLPVLTEHRLDRIALLGGFADGEMRLRAIW